MGPNRVRDATRIAPNEWVNSSRGHHAVDHELERAADPALVNLRYRLPADQALFGHEHDTVEMGLGQRECEVARRGGA